MAERFPYGGQAVMKGVMMRGLQRAAVAVRAPDGQIVIAERTLNSQRRIFWSRWPVLRGILLLGDALGIGIWAMLFSASVADSSDTPALTRRESGMLVLTSVALSIGIFFVLPQLLATGLISLFGGGVLARELCEGLVRLGIFIGYLVLMGRMDDIREVFAYHGAEHKAVAAYEAGGPLTVAEVRQHSTIHPRCGTTLLLVVMVLGIPVFAPLGTLPFWLRILSRIALAPLIAALAYELMRLTSRHQGHPIIRRLMQPALALQRLTTRQPDDSMLEVAIAALERVLVADGQPVEAQPIAVEIRPALTS